MEKWIKTNVIKAEGYETYILLYEHIEGTLIKSYSFSVCGYGGQGMFEDEQDALRDANRVINASATGGCVDFRKAEIK